LAGRTPTKEQNNLLSDEACVGRFGEYAGAERRVLSN